MLMRSFSRGSGSILGGFSTDSRSVRSKQKLGMLPCKDFMPGLLTNSLRQRWFRMSTETKGGRCLSGLPTDGFGPKSDAEAGRCSPGLGAEPGRAGRASGLPAAKEDGFRASIFALGGLFGLGSSLGRSGADSGLLLPHGFFTGAELGRAGTPRPSSVGPAGSGLTGMHLEETFSALRDAGRSWVAENGLASFPRRPFSLASAVMNPEACGPFGSRCP